MFILSLTFLMILLNSLTEGGGGGVLDSSQAINELVKTFTEEYKVVVTNNCSNSIYLKCASADDTITGKGSSKDGWWTLKAGQALGWGFTPNNFGTTCFWCYANNNGKAARKSGNWYIHQDVWGWEECDGPANQDWNHKITEWQMRNRGAFSNMCEDCKDGKVFEKYESWGPPPDDKKLRESNENSV